MTHTDKAVDKPVSVEPFPPGEFIQDELDARGWTQDDLAEVMQRTRQHVSRLLKGQTAIGPETAHELAAAFGTTAEMWMNLQTSFELSKAACDERRIQKRAELFGKIPVRDMRKRGWISEEKDPFALTQEVCRFLSIPDLEAQPGLRLAARKSTSYGAHSLGQVAWGQRALQLAQRVGAATYSDSNLAGCIQELRLLTAHPEDTRRVPAVLASCGIRMVIVQHLQGTKIDAAAMWLDDASPVIAMSLRFGRIDNFWHNLFHELIHIKYRDEPVVDIAMNDSDSHDDGGVIELRANTEAAEALISADKLDSFIARHKPLFYQAKVIQFAAARGVHPGIVVGQLHSRGVLDFKQLRKLLVDVRQYVAGSALTDGWGDCPVIA